MMLDTGLHPIWIALLAIYFIATLVASVLLVFRRKYGMMRFRNPKLIGLQIFISFMMVVMICIRESMRNSFPCWAYVVIMNLFTPMYFLPLFYQAMFCHHVTNHTTVNTETQEVSGLIQNLKRKRGLFAAGCGILLSFHVVLIAVQLFYASEHDTLTAGCAWDPRVEYSCMAAVSGVYALAFGIISIWVLRNAKDPYSLKNDLRIAFAWCLIWGTTFFVLNLTPPLWGMDNYVPFSVCIYVMVFGLLCYLAIRPCVLAKNADYDMFLGLSLNRGTKKFERISDYLEDKDAMAALRTWCNKVDHIRLKDLDCMYDAYVYFEAMRQRNSGVGLKGNYSSLGDDHARLRNLVVNVVTHVSDRKESTPSLQNYITADEEVAVTAIVSAHSGLPTCNQFEPYLRFCAIMCEHSVIPEFLESEEFKLFNAKVREDSKISMNIAHSIRDENEQAMNLIDCDSLSAGYGNDDNV